MDEARRVVDMSDIDGDGARVVDVGEYLWCVDEARAVTGDDEIYEDDEDAVITGKNSPGIALMRFCGRHGLEREGWSRDEDVGSGEGW